MCTNMRQFAQFDPSWQLTKAIGGEKRANKLVDPAGVLGIQDQMDTRVAAEEQARRSAAQQKAAQTAYGSSMRTLENQPATGRTILGG